MNVHGTHASAGQTEHVGAHAKPTKANNDCQIQAAEFARMLTQLMDKTVEPSAEGAANASAASTVKSEG